MAHEFLKFNAGSDEREHAQVSEAPIRLVINGEYDSNGGISKRHGFAQFPAGLNGAGGEAWGVSSLLSAGRLWGVLRAWDFMSGKQVALPPLLTAGLTAGQLTSVANGFRTERAFAVHDGASLTTPHCAVQRLAGVLYACVVAARGADSLVTIVEVESGAVLARRLLAAEDNPQVVPVTTATPTTSVAFHVYTQNAANEIYVRNFTVGDDGEVEIVATGAGITSAFTATCVYATYSEGTTTLVAGRDNASNDLVVKRVNAGCAVTVAISQAVTGAAPTVCHLEKDDAGAVHVAHCSGSGTNTGYLETFNSGLTARTLGSTALIAGSPLRSIHVCNLPGSTTMAIVARSAPLFVDVLHNIIDTDHTDLGTVQTVQAAHPLARPLTVRYGTTGARPFVGCTFYRTGTTNIVQQPTAALLGIPRGAGQVVDNFTVPVTNVEHGGVLWKDNVIHRSGTAQLAHVGYDSSTGDYYIPITTATTYLTEQQEGVTGISVVRLTPGLGEDAADVALPRATLQGTPYLGGALLRFFDGQSLGEVVPAPVQIVSAVQGAGAALAAGTYNYSVLVKWTDAQGRVHRSAPSVPFAEVHAGANGVVVTAAMNFPTMLMGDVGSQQWLAELYRTEASGSTFFRVKSEAFTPNADYTFSEDNQSDAQLVDNEVLYTDGDILPNEQPPAALALCANAGRLWLVSAQDPNTLWCSKVLEEGYAPEFNPALQVRLDEPAVALASMDEKLVAFTESGAYVILGEGPDNLGAGAFSPPEPITGSLGATSHAAVQSTPVGILVQSAAGFQLMGRDLSVQDVDLLSESFPAESNVVGASLHVPDQQQVWFSSPDVPRDFVVYDYSDGLRAFLWQVGMSSVDYLRDLAMVNGSPYLLAQHTTPEPKLWVQDDGFDDGGTFVARAMYTGWFVPDGWNGDCRFRNVAILGETPNGAGGCTLHLEAYVQRPNESNNSGVNTFSWSALESPGAPRFHRRDRLQHQRGVAARAYITEESSGTADVAGPTWTGLDWDYEVRGAPTKQSPAKTST